MWEAQFGDFGNGAQMIVDEFISSGEVKWGQKNALTLLLPHGHEGQGPDHTSGRPERYLQLAAEDNMRVAIPSTPANYFHLLRRQALTPKRKPLVVFTPKSLLRHKLAVSSVSDFTTGTFQPVLLDDGINGAPLNPADVNRVLLCSGKVYYDLLRGPGRAWHDRRPRSCGSSSSTRCRSTSCGRRWHSSRTRPTSRGCRRSRPTRARGRSWR